VFDADTPTVIIGGLPKAEALFITVEGGDIVMSFQGLSSWERPAGVVTVGAAPGPECAKYERGVTHMGCIYNRRRQVKTYGFGVLNTALDPNGADFMGSSLSLYGQHPVTQENAFEHTHYIYNNPPPDMAMLKPVRITD
jgi:hypothetical protein